MNVEDRTEKIRDLLSQHMQLRSGSSTVTDEELVQTHPELMPELLRELRKLKLIDQARQEARHQDVSTNGGPRDQLSTETFSEDHVIPPLDANVPDYNLLRQIGKGGFGEVWLGHHRLHGEYVAVKIIAKERLVELEGVRAYKHQAKQHSNLVPIEHVGETDNCYYYVMPLADDVKGPTALRSPEYYEPKTLQWCLDNLPPMTPEEVRDLALQLLDAIADLHQAGLMHADVKPANIMQLQGTWKLGDLGLMTRNEQLTLGRGTVAFWPPEGTSGPSADLYALGKTLYLALTNASLDSFDDFIAGSLPLSGDPVLIDHLRRLIKKSCDSDPEQRLQTAREFRDLLNQPAPRSRQPVKQKRPITIPWRRVTIIAASLLLICLLSYGAVQLWKNWPFPGGTASSLFDNQPLENLLVEHLPLVETIDKGPFGTIGVSSFWVKPAHQLGVHVNLKKPARFFIVLLKSPGDMQLIYPPSDQSDSSVPTARSTLEMPVHIDEPPGETTLKTPFCMGIMLVILNKPLTFTQWSSTLNPATGKNWPPTQSKHCWFYQDDMQLVEARSRGSELSKKPVPEPPAQLVQFCQAVQENEGTGQVQLTVFPVLPSHVGSWHD